MAAAALAAGVLGGAAHTRLRALSPPSPAQPVLTEADVPVTTGPALSATGGWDTPVVLQHAPVLGPSEFQHPAAGHDHRSANPNSTAGGLAGSGVAAAPLDRDLSAPPPSSSSPSMPLASSHPPAGAAPTSQPDLDRLTEDVLHNLRWRLAIERERLMA
jgi:hypothetical protein